MEHMCQNFHTKIHHRESITHLDGKVIVVAVSVRAITLAPLGNKLLSSPMCANAVRNLSPQVFTQCASSTTGPL